MKRIELPRYSIPRDLEEVLEKNLEVFPHMSKKSQIFMEILNTLKNVDYVDIFENHHLQLLKLALYLEEYQSKSDMKNGLFDKRIKKCNDTDPQSNLFQIPVDDEEDKFFMKQNDYIDVIDTTDNTLYTLRVRNVTRIDIIVSDDNAGLSKTYATEKLYNIQFKVSNHHSYPWRCAHYALWLMHERNSLSYLFPFKNKSFIKNDVPEYGGMKVINPIIDENYQQKQAILNIINKSSFPAPYILYGPPGTGKTDTLVEAMCQLYYYSSGSHILVCTPSNTAADEITKRLLKFVPPEYVYRMYSQSKNGLTIDAVIQKCCNYSEGKIVYTKYEEVVKKRIIITTVCNSMRLICMRMPKNHFSHLIIDEAGHCTEPDILIPISLVSGNGELHSQIVLAGDPQQLGPTIKSKISKTIIGRSILERLMSYDTYKKDSNNKYPSRYITKLCRNYRSHPAIIGISNKLFYDNELISMSQNNNVNEKFPIIFHGIKGKEEKYTSSTSSCNDKEIHLVVKYVDDLLNNKMQFGGISTKDIGIVTPFTLQSKKIKKILKDKNLKDINVGTVDLFQGQERKIMIMTTVRSKTFVHDGLEHIGFLSNPKRFNVAITRAKDMLVVIGNPDILQIDNKWHYLLKFCVDNKSYKGLTFSLDHFNGIEENASKLLKIVDSTSLLKNCMSELFILGEHLDETCLNFDDDAHSYYEHLIDSLENLDIFDDIYDDYYENNFTDFDEDSNIYEDIYDEDDEDLFENEDDEDLFENEDDEDLFENEDDEDLFENEDEEDLFENEDEEDLFENEDEEDLFENDNEGNLFENENLNHEEYYNDPVNVTGSEDSEYFETEEDLSYDIQNDCISGVLEMLNISEDYNYYDYD